MNPRGGNPSWATGVPVAMEGSGGYLPVRLSCLMIPLMVNSQCFFLSNPYRLGGLEYEFMTFHNIYLLFSISYMGCHPSH